jgi:hypothetical protein
MKNASYSGHMSGKGFLDSLVSCNMCQHRGRSCHQAPMRAGGLLTLLARVYFGIK